ncbi:MAG: NlpC/P60 family protein [Deltaproteobacteria bacterium]|nr:NlpC/P60 family protein [Deltaproteobacteria bacterium]
MSAGFPLAAAWGKLCLLPLLLAAGCASVPMERSASLSRLAYEQKPAFEDRAVALLGVGLFLSESLLAPGLADPEARMLQAAGSLVAAARHGAAAGLAQPSTNGVLKTAFSKVGLPYKFGGTSPQTGFDCSGFVGWVYGQHGVKLPRSSPEMLSVGQAVPRPKLTPGDLVFFGRKQRVTHVGIYTGNNRYIHSPSRGKSIQESSLDDRSRGEYYVGARRLLPGLPPGIAETGPALMAASDNEGMLVKSAEVLEDAAQAHAKAETRLKAAEPAPAAGGTKEAISRTNNKMPPKTHKVQAGDTLYDLARKYGLSQTELARANKLDQKQQTLIRPGQVLSVPTRKK